MLMHAKIALGDNRLKLEERHAKGKLVQPSKKNRPCGQAFCGSLILNFFTPKAMNKEPRSTQGNNSPCKYNRD